MQESADSLDESTEKNIRKLTELEEKEKDMDNGLNDLQNKLGELEKTKSQFETATNRLQDAQTNLLKAEQLVQDLKSEMELANRTHKITLDELKIQYDNSCAEHRKEKDQLTRKVADIESNKEELRQQIEHYRRMGDNSAAQVTKATIDNAVEIERLAADSRRRQEKNAMEDSHDRLVRQLKESHQSSIAAQQTKIDEAAIKITKLEKRIKLRDNENAAYESRIETIAEELQEKKQEYTDVVKTLWHETQQKHVIKAFDDLRDSVQRLVGQHGIDLESALSRTNKLAGVAEQWTQSLQQMQQHTDTQLATHEKQLKEFSSSTISELRNLLNEAESQIKEGVTGIATLKLSKSHHETALDALDLMKRNEEYRNAVDNKLIEARQTNTMLQNEITTHTTRIDELEAQLKACRDEARDFGTLKAELAALTQAQSGETQALRDLYADEIEKRQQEIRDLENKLREKIDEHRQLVNTEALVRDKEREIAGMIVAMDTKQKFLDETDEKLRKCRAEGAQVQLMQEQLAETKADLEACTAHRAEIDVLQRQLQENKDLLYQCNAHNAISNAKARQYDDLVFREEEIRNLRASQLKLNNDILDRDAANADLAKQLAECRASKGKEPASRPAGSDQHERSRRETLTATPESPSDLLTASRADRRSRRDASGATQATNRSGMSMRKFGGMVTDRIATGMKTAFTRTRNRDYRPLFSPGGASPRRDSLSPDSEEPIRPASRAAAGTDHILMPGDTVTMGSTSNLPSRERTERTSAFRPDDIVPTGESGARAGLTSTSHTDLTGNASTRLRHQRSTSATTSVATVRGVLGSGLAGISTSSLSSTLGKHYREGATPDRPHKSRTLDPAHSESGKGAEVSRRARSRLRGDLPQAETLDPRGVADQAQDRLARGHEGDDVDDFNMMGDDNDEPHIQPGSETEQSQSRAGIATGRPAIQGAEPEDEDVIEQRRTGQIPPRLPAGVANWRGDFTSDSGRIAYTAVRKTPNWDNTVNNHLVDMLNNPRRRVKDVVDDLHMAPQCMASHLARAGKQNIVEGQTEPCDFCKDKNTPCWGLKQIDGTINLAGPVNKKKKQARVQFQRDEDGYYWEAFYRPRRDPGGDDNGREGGDGNIGGASGFISAT